MMSGRKAVIKFVEIQPFMPWDKQTNVWKLTWKKALGWQRATKKQTLQFKRKLSFAGKNRCTNTTEKERRKVPTLQRGFISLTTTTCSRHKRAVVFLRYRSLVAVAKLWTTHSLKLRLFHCEMLRWLINSHFEKKNRRSEWCAFLWLCDSQLTWKWKQKRGERNINGTRKGRGYKKIPQVQRTLTPRHNFFASKKKKIRISNCNVGPQRRSSLQNDKKWDDSPVCSFIFISFLFFPSSPNKPNATKQRSPRRAHRTQRFGKWKKKGARTLAQTVYIHILKGKTKSIWREQARFNFFPQNVPHYSFWRDSSEWWWVGGKQS